MHDPPVTTLPAHICNLPADVINYIQTFSYSRNLFLTSKDLYYMTQRIQYKVKDNDICDSYYRTIKYSITFEYNNSTYTALHIYQNVYNSFDFPCTPIAEHSMTITIDNKTYEIHLKYDLEFWNKNIKEQVLRCIVHQLEKYIDHVHLIFFVNSAKCISNYNVRDDIDDSHTIQKHANNNIPIDRIRCHKCNTIYHQTEFKNKHIHYCKFFDLLFKKKH
jgi:hypothetical protein